MKIVNVSSYELFDQAIKSQLTNHENLYVFMYGTNEESTGKSWCIDCRNSFELVKVEIAKVKDSILILAATGNRET